MRTAPCLGSLLTLIFSSRSAVARSEPEGDTDSEVRMELQWPSTSAGSTSGLWAKMIGLSMTEWLGSVALPMALF